MLIHAGIFSLLALYLLFAGFALFMGYDKQRETNNENPLFITASFLACLFWSITILRVFIAIQWQTSNAGA